MCTEADFVFPIHLSTKISVPRLIDLLPMLLSTVIFHDDARFHNVVRILSVPHRNGQPHLALCAGHSIDLRGLISKTAEVHSTTWQEVSSSRFVLREHRLITFSFGLPEIALIARKYIEGAAPLV